MPLAIRIPPYYCNYNLSLSHTHLHIHTLTGLLWSKQFYNYIIEAWLDGDPEQPEPPRERLFGRNASGDWAHLFNRDVISMPDKWEYPWVSNQLQMNFFGLKNSAQ